MDGRRLGILIASSVFPAEEQLLDLRFPVNDVEGLNAVLASEHLGGFTETVMLTNEPSHAVLLTLNRILRKALKDDFVLLYYSGHGKLNPAGSLHLATTDTVLDALEATSIPIQTLKNYIDISPACRIALILDCCYSGAAGEIFSRGGVDEQLQFVSRGRGTFIMTASTGIQVALEKETDRLGMFTKHLIAGIREGAADRDGDGLITLDELYGYVHDRCLEEGCQEPMKWDLNVRGEVVIASTGKSPRAQWRRKVRERMLELAEQQLVPDEILLAVLALIEKDPLKLEQADRQKEELVRAFSEDKLAFNQFVQRWYATGGRASGQAPGKASAQLTVDPARGIDFGSVPAGGTPERLVTITNSGEGRLEWDCEQTGDFFTLQRTALGLKVRLACPTSGRHKGEVRIQSTGGSARIPVRVRATRRACRAAATPEGRVDVPPDKRRRPVWRYGAGALAVLGVMVYGYLSGEFHFFPTATYRVSPTVTYRASPTEVLPSGSSARALGERPAAPLAMDEIDAQFERLEAELERARATGTVPANLTGRIQGLGTELNATRSRISSPEEMELLRQRYVRLQGIVVEMSRLQLQQVRQTQPRR